MLFVRNGCGKVCIVLYVVSCASFGSASREKLRCAFVCVCARRAQEVCVYIWGKAIDQVSFLARLTLRHGPRYSLSSLCYPRLCSVVKQSQPRGTHPALRPLPHQLHHNLPCPIRSFAALTTFPQAHISHPKSPAGFSFCARLHSSVSTHKLNSPLFTLRSPTIEDDWRGKRSSDRFIASAYPLLFCVSLWSEGK